MLLYSQNGEIMHNIQLVGSRACVYCAFSEAMYILYGHEVHILMLLQVVHMQCNVELIEEGTKFHVSVLCKTTILYTM